MPNSMVTGGFGFVGRHLVRMLIDRGDNVTVFDVTAGCESLKDIMHRLTVIVGNLDNWTQVASAIKENKVDTIYHLGALLPPMSEQDPSAAFYSNIVGTFNILEAARILGVKTVMYTSTQTTFEPGASSVTDDSAQRPINMYGMTKVCSERLGEAYWRKYGLNFRGVRYAVVNGPGRDSAAGGQIIVWTLQMAALSRPFALYFEPDTEMDTIYVKDAARLLIELKDADESRLTQRVYNLPSLTFTTRQLVEVVKKHIPDADLSFRVSKNMMRMVTNGRLTRRLDSRLAERDWGAKLEYDLDKTMQDYIKECQEHRELIDQPPPDS